MSKPRIEHVTWRDATGYAGWQNPEREKYAGLICQTIGWVVEDTKVHIALAGSIAPEASLPVAAA